MNDKRTPKQKYEAWVDAVNVCYSKGWTNVNQWLFMSPSGSIHDLSCADLSKLDTIEVKDLFIRSDVK